MAKLNLEQIALSIPMNDSIKKSIPEPSQALIGVFRYIRETQLTDETFTAETLCNWIIKFATKLNLPEIQYELFTSTRRTGKLLCQNADKLGFLSAGHRGNRKLYKIQPSEITDLDTSDVMSFGQSCDLIQHYIELVNNKKLLPSDIAKRASQI